MPLKGYTGVDMDTVERGTKAWRQAARDQQEWQKGQFAQGKTLADMGVQNVHELGRANYNFWGGEEGAKQAGQEFGKAAADKNVAFGHWKKAADGTYYDDSPGRAVQYFDQYGKKTGGGPGPTGSQIDPVTGQPIGSTGTTKGPVTMESVLQDILSGKDTSMNDTVVAGLEGRAKRRQSQLKQQAGEQLDADAIRRGVYNSKSAAGQKATANRAIDADLSEQVTNIGLQKATQDHADKLAALDRMQRSLESNRQFALAQESNSLQRQNMLAQIDLANRRISEERDALNARFDFDRSMAEQSNQWNIDAYNRDLPFRTAQFESSLMR